MLQEEVYCPNRAVILKYCTASDQSDSSIHLRCRVIPNKSVSLPDETCVGPNQEQVPQGTRLYIIMISKKIKKHEQRNRRVHEGVELTLQCDLHTGRFNEGFFHWRLQIPWSGARSMCRSGCCGQSTCTGSRRWEKPSST